MKDFSQFNTGSKKTIRDGINLDSLGDFHKLKEFVGQELIVDGFFFTSGKYGDQCVIVASGRKINLPKRFADDFKKFRDDQETLDSILAGGLKLVNIREIDAQNGKTVTFEYANA